MTILVAKMNFRNVKRRAGRLACFATASHGTAAVEFAIILPVLVFLVFGIFAASWVLTVQHGLQQLAAEAVRAALPGLSATERDGLAKAYVTASAPTYAFLNPSGITVSTQSVPATMSFTVTTTYDLSTSPLYTSLIRFIPNASKTVVRQATIRQGGIS